MRPRELSTEAEVGACDVAQGAVGGMSYLDLVHVATELQSAVWAKRYGRKSTLVDVILNCACAVWCLEVSP